MQQKFRREEYAADRGIKGRRDARARAGGDERSALPGGKTQPLPDTRTKSRANLDDRTFAPDRTAAADRESRGERFHHGHDRPDDALVIINRVHHFGHAVAARFRRKGLHQPGHADRAEHRDEDDESAPWTRRGVDV